DTEEGARTAADAAEATARAEADTILETADTALGTRIDTEEGARTAADAAEATARAEADTILETADTALGGRIDGLNQKVDELESDLSAGIAMSMAMQAPSISRGKKLSLSVGFGTYNSETAVAFSFATRIDSRWSVNGSVGYGSSRGDIGGRMGATIEF
ncbi:MAG: hemagglutinin, partial [Methylococcales symbiont of Iophon sp. n. MRB-2018]